MIGVCIKYFHENYGGMLQALATVKILEERGLKYELIQYEKKKTMLFIIKSLPRLLNKVFLNDKIEILKKKHGFQHNPEFALNDNIRMQAFKKFSGEHFTNLSEIYHGYDALCKGVIKYQAVVTGSDQLWSPAGLPTNYYNLMFVPNDIRKISYASSFGVTQIPWYQKKRTKKFLKRIEYISMRENRGSEIVKELIGRDVCTVLDPVFMFDKDGWETLIPVNQEIKAPYIFAYFLGNSPEQREAVKKAAEKLGCKIVTLRHLDQYIGSDEQFGDFAPYDVEPARFLNLLRGAQYVCTDSFHGSVFSIIHRKQFVIFNRYDENSTYSKNSRIDTVCQNLNLLNRRFVRSEQLYKQLIKEIDYIAVDAQLKKLKQETDDYLDIAFKSIG